MGNTASPVQAISDEDFQNAKVDVFIKRDDLLHPHVMGNKWRKLKYNLKYVEENQLEGIVTLGGAFSNHIAATAAACNLSNRKSIGIIRGEELYSDSNATLRFAGEEGMELRFVDRSTYRELRKGNSTLRQDFPEYWVLPEGGTNELAIKGCQEIIEELDQSYDYMVTPIGTGGTMAGLLKGLGGRSTLVGISSLKGSFIHEEFKKLLTQHNIHYTNYEIMDQFHFGGYGKVTPELIDFINATKQVSGILLDPIYTGKMYFAVKRLAIAGFFKPGSKVLVIHTGGLQGIIGFNEFREKKILI